MRNYESYDLYAKHVLSFNGFGHFVFNKSRGRQSASCGRFAFGALEAAGEALEMPQTWPTKGRWCTVNAHVHNWVGLLVGHTCRISMTPGFERRSTLEAVQIDGDTGKI